MADAVLADWAACDRTDTLFVVVCTCICWTIVPTVGIAYGGYAWKRNGLSSAIPALLVTMVCAIQWWLVGYTLAYGPGGSIVGGLDHLLHRGVLAQPVGTIPALLFSQFQLVFEATVCALAVGGFCERARLLPVIPFVFLWSTFIYCPLAHMVWGGGFLGETLGALDFAGGTPVHVCSGATAMALSLYLSYPLFRSRRSAVRTPHHIRLHRPGNSFYQLLSLIVIWGSWLAFDAGTTLTLSFQSLMALAVTNLCASAGALTWALMTFVETGRWSVDAIFMGAISGLVMITPAAGFVGLSTSFFLGVLGALICRQSLRIKFTPWARRVRWVDNADVFATHCVGGLAATLCTGLFAQKEVAAYGEIDIVGGVFFDGNIRQLAIQAAEALIGLVWAGAGSFAIIALIDCVPGFEVLALDKHIEAGLDTNETEESLSGYEHPDEAEYTPIYSDPVTLE